MMPNQRYPYSNSPRRPLPPCSQPQTRPTPPCEQLHTRPAAPCPCSQPSRKQLLSIITLTGFAALDSGMYLDTHPDDREALCYFHENMHRYNEAMAEYAKSFGPLTLSHATHNREYWDWVNQPWPWE